MEIQILELTEIYSSSGESQIACFGRTDQNKLVSIFIKGTPITLSWAIGPYFSADKIDIVYNKLVHYLVHKKFRCRRTQCSCNTGSYGVYREPCTKETPPTENPVLGWKLVSARGFLIAEQHERLFVEFSFRYPFMLKQAAEFLNSLAENEQVLPIHRGVYDNSKVAVDAFLLGKKVSSFEWIQVPEKDGNVFTYDEIVKCNDQSREDAPWSMFVLDIEVISVVYRNHETKQAAYPVGIISCWFQGKFTSFALKSPNVEDEIYNTEDDYDESIRLLEEIPIRADYEVDEDQVDELLTPEEMKLTLENWRESIDAARVCERGSLRIPFGTVFYVEREYDLLRQFRDFYLSCNPDITSGYNSNFYDFPYIIRRGLRLGIPKFDYFSRLPDQPLVILLREKKTKQAGTREQTFINCPGRVFMDLFPICQAALKLDNYKLGTVANSFKFGGKADVGYDEIHPKFHGTSMTRLELLRYCIRDVDLPVKIASIMDLVRRQIAKSRVLRVRVQDALDRGLAYVLSMMVRDQIKSRYLINMEIGNVKTLHHAYETIPGCRELFNAAIESEKYDGAFVIEPTTGVREGCVVTFDFNSLYPSLARTFNICHSTLVPPPTKDSWYTWDDVYQSPVGFCFLKEHIMEGELPRVWKIILDRRKDVRQQIAILKARVKEEKRPFIEDELNKLAMWEAEQKELKIAANSLYGQLGTLLSDLSLLPGAVSITSFGKYFLQKIHAEIENCEEFKQYGLRVVYGDTDSLMIELQTVTDRSIGDVIGRRIEQWINVDSGLLPSDKHLHIEYENLSLKTYFNAKKCYVKVLLDDDGCRYLKQSGMEKRDLTKYNSTTTQTILEMALLNNKTASQIALYFRKRCARLLSRRLADISLLQHTSNISKHLSEFTTPQPHIEAAKLLEESGNEVRVGDRITFYKCMTGRRNGKVSESTIPLELFKDGYVLDMDAYVREIVNFAEKKLLDFFPGETTEERLTCLHNCAWQNVRVNPSTFRVPPKPRLTGAMDKFVSSTPSGKTLSKKVQMNTTAVSRQSNIFGKPLTLAEGTAAAAKRRKSKRKSSSTVGQQKTLTEMFSTCQVHNSEEE